MAQNKPGAAGRFRDAGLFMAAFILLLVALMIAVSLLFGGTGDVAVSYLISAVAEAALAIPALIYIRVKHIRLSAWFGRAQTGQIAAAAFAGVLAVPVSMAIGMLWELVVIATGGNIAGESVPIPQTAWQLAAALLATGVAAPLVEEPVYRGLILGAQASVRGRRQAVLFTAVLFALIHGRFVGLPSIFLAGLLLTALAWHSGSIWPSVAAHASYNAMTMITATLMGKIAANMPMRQVYSPDAVTVAQVAAAAMAWVVLALPFAAGLAAVLVAYFRHTPAAERIQEKTAARLGFSVTWPWFVSIFLLLCYLAIDVLRVYGIING